MREKNQEFCPVCKGEGQLEDAKTHKIRDCVMCLGSGVINKLKLKK